MAAIAWKARIVDLDTDTVLATTDTIINPAYGATLDTPGPFHAEFRPGSLFFNAIITALGGPTYNTDPLMCICEMSQDNGSSWDTAMWIETGNVFFGGDQVGVILDGKDLFDGFNRSYIDQATYIDIQIDDVLSALPGQIAVPSGSLMLASAKLPLWWFGLFQHAPGRNNMAGAHRLQFTAYTNPTLSGKRVDVAINSVSIFDTLGDVIKSGAGVLDPARLDLFGANQHFTPDVRNRNVYAGYKGTLPVMSISNLISPASADETTEAAIVDGDTSGITLNLDAWIAQTEFIYGSSSHGMPDGGSFTGAVMINKPVEASSTNPYDNLLLVSIATGNNGGGVYTWIKDGALRKMSQTIDVHDIKLDGTANKLYIGTRSGMFFRDTSYPYESAPWTRAGTLNYEFTKVWIPDTGIVFAVASGSNNGDGINGVWRWDGTNWNRVVLDSTLIDASGSDSAFYYVDDTDPTNITYTTYPGTASGNDIAIPGGAHVEGMDFDATSGEVVVRTELGAAGLYRISGGTITQVDPANSLHDDFGPISVAQFVDYSGTINGQSVAGFVSADRGIWWRATPTGQFAPTDGQSGIQNVNASWLAIGAPQTIMGRTFIPLAAVSSSEIYYTMDGGLHWDALMARPGDCGPAWYAAIQRFTGDYPYGDFGAFGNGFDAELIGTPGFGETDTGTQDPTDPEGNGKIIQVPYGDPLTLPALWVCARRWTNNNTFTYRLVNTQSHAPYNAMKPYEMSDVQDNDSRSVLDASGACLTGAYRLLAQSSKPQLALTATIVQTRSDAISRALLCGDMVNVTYYVAYEDAVVSVLIDLEDQPMFVIDKQGAISPQSGEWTWTLSLVNNTVFNLLDVDTIVRALALNQSRDRRAKRTRVAA